MHGQWNPISRAFYATFSVAVVVEAISAVCNLLGYVDFGSTWSSIWFAARYLPLVALGFMLGRVARPYRTAFANTWPFVILWFVVGMVIFRLGEAPPNFDAGKVRLAQWGFVIATLMFLPVAFFSSAIGVWLSRQFRRSRPGDANAA